MRVQSRGSILARQHKSDPELSKVDGIYEAIEAARHPSNPAGLKAGALNAARGLALAEGLDRVRRLGDRLKEQFVSPIDKVYIRQEYAYLKDRLLALAAPTGEAEVVRADFTGDGTNLEKTRNAAIFQFAKILDGAFQGKIKELLPPSASDNGEWLRLVVSAKLADEGQKAYGTVLDMAEVLPRLATPGPQANSGGLQPAEWVDRAIDEVRLQILNRASGAMGVQGGLAEAKLYLLA